MANDNALIARALVRRPRVLVLDEPTNGLDLEAEDTALRFLAELNRQEQHTVLFVTHNIALAARYATHVAFFHAGSVVSGRAKPSCSGRLWSGSMGSRWGLPQIPRALLRSGSPPWNVSS